MKKRFFIAFLMMLALMFTALAGCDMGGDPTDFTGNRESVSISEQESTSISSESKAQSESKKPSSVESKPAGNLTVPTFSINVDTTETTLFFDVEENDPDNVGDITAISLLKGKEETKIEDLTTRTFEGLYSNTQYTVVVTYTYDVGAGAVSTEYKKFKYTKGLRAPSLSLEYEAVSETSLSFDLNIKDTSNILKILSIKLVSASGEEIFLSDLNEREFTNIPNGEYDLVVEYQYDLNRGDGPVVKESVLHVATKLDPLSIPDFIVHVDEGKNPVILQITDTQIIDGSQWEEGDNIDANYYASKNFDVRLGNYLRETINAVKPDLIIMTGDNVYGRFDDDGSALIKLVNIMESFGIPWAPVFGNHDNESKKGVAWQCAQYENAPNCLFKRGMITGNSNYTVGIEQGGKLTRVFFMMDSNNCASPSAQSIEDGQMRIYNGFAQDQVDWFETVGKVINQASPETKISFAFHVQVHAFKEAFTKYGHSTTNDVINIDSHPNLEAGDMGYIGSTVTGTWDNDDKIFEKMVAIGCDSIYVGHEHNMSASVVYEGVRFQFGQKIGTYDGVNWLRPNGQIEFEFSSSACTGTPIMGGSVNVLDSTGKIVDAYIYFCGGVSHNGRA